MRRRPTVSRPHQSYDAVSGLARLLGRAAALSSDDTLTLVIGTCQPRAYLVSIISAHARTHAAEILDVFRSCVSDAQQGWHLTATSAILLMSEVVFGASSAWPGLSSQEGLKDW